MGRFFGKKNKEEVRVFDNILSALSALYKETLLPLEEHYKFHHFHSPKMTDSDFKQKPMVLLIGQYSTGKTTFIKYLLGSDFPGMRIGPEPTTDRFNVIMHGEEDMIIPGNALVVNPKYPFTVLQKYGNGFLNRFQLSQMPNELLESVSIIDTPGILSGEKQRLDRGYEFERVLEWFAEKVDSIVLIFDAHKLDISDEFKRAIEAIKNYDEKMQIILNKADMVNTQQLMRIYGALLWSLAKVLRTPEVVRVYIGSFWDQALHFDMNRKLFEAEEHDLFDTIQKLPKNAALRKLNDFIKRARLAKVHAYIISSIKSEMPAMFGKEKKKQEIINLLPQVYAKVQKEISISPGDFPNIQKLQRQLVVADFSKFASLNKKLIDAVDRMLGEEIPKLTQMVPTELQAFKPITTGYFASAEDSPFGKETCEGVDRGRGEMTWVVEKQRQKYDQIFWTLHPVDGHVTGSAAKTEMQKSKLPNTQLGKVWKLADIDKDGFLDIDEFALAMYLIELKLDGNELPNTLPSHLVPPSHGDNCIPTPVQLSPGPGSSVNM